MGAIAIPIGRRFTVSDTIAVDVEIGIASAYTTAIRSCACRQTVPKSKSLTLSLAIHPFFTPQLCTQTRRRRWLCLRLCSWLVYRDAFITPPIPSIIKQS